MSLVAKLRHETGIDALESPDGPPRIRPTSVSAAAAIVRTAAAVGARIRISGRGSWVQAQGAPADLILSTEALTAIPHWAPDDLVISAEAGLSIPALNDRLRDTGLWLPVDAPGHPDRSVGSVVATASSGPLRASAGPIRDHLLGLVVVTGAGDVLRVGGRVAKNVAGYDLTRLMCGAFGAFGLIVEVHLRLRPRPEADATTAIAGDPNQLVPAAHRLAADGASRPAALALVSCQPQRTWMLAARFAGLEPAVRADVARVRSLLPNSTEMLVDEAQEFWARLAARAVEAPLTIRVGALPQELSETLALIERTIGLGAVEAGPLDGIIRWSGECGAPPLRELRSVLAARRIPLTLERAPWPLLEALGHFGKLPDPVGRLTAHLRAAFDPGSRLVVPTGVS